MSMGRPREFDSEQALQAAMDIFWQKGFEATSLQDLLKGMKLSKSSLYQSFGSKQQLFQQCLQQYRSMMTDMMNQLLEEAETGIDFIEKLLRSVAEQAVDSQASQRGCLITNTASEFAQSDADIARLVKTGMEGFTAVFQK
ncbi:TetR/AcrR family transcriptional regulator, partial [Kaarinaea lacus]